MNNFTICADFTTSIGADPKNANLQIMDFDLYPSSTDLGPVLPDSHLYKPAAVSISPITMEER
jgi:hypothetical protein